MPQTLAGAVYRADELTPQHCRLVTVIETRGTYVVDVPPTANPVMSVRSDPAGALVTTEHRHGLFANDNGRFTPVFTPNLAITPGYDIPTSALIYRNETAFIVDKNSEAGAKILKAKNQSVRVSTSVTSSVHNLVATITARLPPCLTFANSSDGAVRLTAYGALRVQASGLAQFLRLQAARSAPTTVTGELPMQRFAMELLEPTTVAAAVVTQLSPTRVAQPVLVLRMLNSNGTRDFVLPPGGYDGETVVRVFNSQFVGEHARARLDADGALVISAQQPFTVIGGADALDEPPPISVGRWFEAHACHDVRLELFRHARGSRGTSTPLPGRAFAIAATGSQMVEFQGTTVCAEASVFHAPVAPSGIWRPFDDPVARLCSEDIGSGDRRSFARVDARPLDFVDLNINGVPVAFTRQADATKGLLTSFEHDQRLPLAFTR